MVTLDENHKYFVDGIQKPGVHEILRAEGHIDSFIDTLAPYYSEFGIAAHCMTQLELNNDLDEESVDEDLLPTLTAWKKFRSDYPWLPICNNDGGNLIETPIYHSLYGYCCTPDYPMTDGKRLIIVDLKNSSSPLPYWGLQLAAQEQAVRHEFDIPNSTKADLYILMIPRGCDMYTLKHYRDNTAWPTFLGILNSYKWKKRYNINQKLAA